MKHLLCAALIYSLSTSAFSQSHENPKLVVGIVIDQMRFDYLYKYSEKFGNEGFRKLINEGFQCKNMQYNYVPTYTGPGHSSIYTGTTPERHGIIANDWYSRDKKALMYCTEDPSVSTVGSTTLKVGQMSPRNLLSTTVGDELRIASNKRSKVIGIALKDRGAILPAGHLADAAYWFDGESGNWVSSTFYQSTIPAWLVDFNAQQKAKSYLNQTWKPLLPIDQYTESLPDQNPYEAPFKGTSSTSFPYDLKDLMQKNGGLNLIRSTPFGNSFTKDLAIETIRAENLGMDEFTDLLCVSFSSPDYIGHQFGPDAIETEDCYLRLDKELAELFAFCDKQVGKGNFMVFLTADHGGATVPAYLIDQRAPGGYLDSKPIKDSISVWLKQISKSEDWLLEYVNEHVYLNETKIINSGNSVEATELLLADKLPFFQGIRSVTTASFLKKQSCTEGSLKLVQKGFHPKRSGNVILTLEPNWMEFSKTGTTHGSPYSYDTRVPMLWYGWKIQHGESVSPYCVDDIASTLSWILNIPFPNSNSGNPIPLPIKN